jgi:glycosyltransferase involved in cell wall biosynthesis
VSERSPAPGLRILFVCGADFTSPSEKQVLWFARELTAAGHKVMVSVYGDEESAVAEGAEQIDGLQIRWHHFLGRRITRADVRAGERFAPDLVHAWNSRPPIVAATRSYARATGAPVFVHWEDDEWGQLDGLPASSLGRQAKHLARRIVARAHPPTWYLSTPWSLAWVTDNAVAHDGLAPALAAEVRARTGADCAVLFPANPPEAWSPTASAPALPAEFERSRILLYTGDINFGRRDDIFMALQAIAAVQQRGFEVTFVHAGRHTAEGDGGLEGMSAGAGMAPGTALELGDLPFARVPPLLRKASILLQPGRGTTFNRFTMPSKLQSYLASGTPCITFASGPGELFEDRVEVLKTYGDSPEELADHIVELLTDDGLRRTLSENGPLAAHRLFDPARNTTALVAHYRAWLQQPE